MTKKVETVEEFLARGGQVTIVPSYQPETNSSTPIKVNSQFTHHQLSLADGEFFFGESRAKPAKRKKISRKDFNTILESSNLPQHIVESIRKSIAEKKNEQ